MQTEPIGTAEATGYSGSIAFRRGIVRADHLRQLPGHTWAVWNWIGLRGAGFPFENVLKLSAPECVAAANRVISAEALVEKSWPEAIDEVRAELGKSPDSRRERSRLLKALKKGKSPDLDGSLLEPGPRLTAFLDATRDLDLAWTGYAECHQRTLDQEYRQIREIVATDRFKEALIWQNRAALIRLRQSLGEVDGGAENSRLRRDLDLVAKYWQRYCTKNDSIGSFGPVGWARFNDSDEMIGARPGPRLIASRTVYFESWCIQALADLLSSDRAVREWIAPRLIADIYVDGDNAYRTFSERLPLTEREARVAGLCDGRNAAREIARLLMAEPSSGFSGEGEVFEVLECLAGRAIISWKFLLRGSSLPEVELRESLGLIGDLAVRRGAIARLEHLEEARNAIAAADGVDSLDRAMAALEDQFTAAVGAAPVRDKGRMYAGRTLVYEDCMRDFSLDLGRDLLRAISEPLTLLLTGARWLSFRMAESARAVCEETYSQLAREAGSRPVDFASLLSRVRAQQLGGRIAPAADCRRMHEEEWASILKIDWEKRLVSYRSEELRVAVAARFQAPGPGWQNARYHCPDLMIAASSVETIGRGDFQLVLGELHLARNTLDTCLFVSQHPSASELRDAIEADLPEPRVVLSPSADAVTSRGRAALQLEKDFLLEFPGAPATPGRSSLPMGSLVVERAGEKLVARVRNGGPDFDLIEFLAGILSQEIVNCFGLPAPGNHRPRVTIDNLVVCRESWILNPSVIDFAYEKDAAYRFVAARRWARELEMPRFVFYRIPGEKKPCFLDLESRLYVSMFANGVRRCCDLHDGGVRSKPANVVITEMLPDPDHLWLTDADGARYTSELRIVALDLSN